MGYIILDIKQKNHLKKLKFFYGSYADGFWNAKLIDEEESRTTIFHYRSLTECYNVLAAILKQAGRVQQIRGSVIENRFIERLRKTLR